MDVRPREQEMLQKAARTDIIFLPETWLYRALVSEGGIRLKIGGVTINGMTALAPMAGVADAAFRTICRQYGASYTVGEMVSAKGLCMSSEKSRGLLTLAPNEHPAAIQLFGSEPESMAQAAKTALEYGPDVIDINMGCPAPKVTSTGAGSALMRSPLLAGRIIESVVRAVEIPVTVKIRRGWDEQSVNAVQIAKIAQESGAEAVTVHGRTRTQQYAPPVDLETIAQVKAAVKIPVIGNGDVRSAADAAKMISQTGCDLVMIGRGALGAPWIFRETETYFKDGSVPPAPDIAERMEVMLRHIKLICAIKGERAAMLEARKHAAWYMSGLRGAASLRAQACQMRTYADAEALAREAAARETEI
jgi:nifR3 family TIM-barrel protein